MVSIVKAHEQFKNYSLPKLVGILKSHESEVTKEMKVVSNLGSLALISKCKGVAEEKPETDLSDNDLTSEEYALMISKPNGLQEINSLPLRTKTDREIIVSRKQKMRTKALL